MASAPKLRQGESIVTRCKASCAIGRRSLWQGDLYLTSQRLIWRRHGFSPPFPKPDGIEIAISSIGRVEAKDMVGALGFLYVNTSDKKYTFVPYHWILALWILFNGRLARDLAKTLDALK